MVVASLRSSARRILLQAPAQVWLVRALRVFLVCRELRGAWKFRQAPGLAKCCNQRCVSGPGRHAVSRRRPIRVRVEHQGGALWCVQPQALSRRLQRRPAGGSVGRDVHAGGGRMLVAPSAPLLGSAAVASQPSRQGSQCQLQPQGSHRSGGGARQGPASSAQQRKGPGHPVPSRTHTRGRPCVCAQRKGQQHSVSACARGSCRCRDIRAGGHRKIRMEI